MTDGVMDPNGFHPAPNVSDFRLRMAAGVAVPSYLVHRRHGPGKTSCHWCCGATCSISVYRATGVVERHRTIGSDIPALNWFVQAELRIAIGI